MVTSPESLKELHWDHFCYLTLKDLSMAHEWPCAAVNPSFPDILMVLHILFIGTTNVGSLYLLLALMTMS